MKAWILILAIVAIAFALRLYRIDEQSLWTDEGYEVDFASQSAERMLEMWSLWQPNVVSVVVSGVADNELAAATDTHAPLHYFLLHYWMQVAGRSELAVRFPSAVFGLLAVVVLYIMGSRLLGRRAGLYAAALGGVSAFFVAYSQEARMYSMSVAFSLISVYLMLRIMRQDRTRMHIGGYVLATTVAMYTHYFAGLVVVFENVFILTSLASSFLASRRERSPNTSSAGALWRLGLVWLLAQASVLLTLLPWAGIILKQLRFPRNEALPVPPIGEVLAWFWQALNGAIRTLPEEAGFYTMLGPAILALLILARSIADKRSRSAVAMLSLYLAIPVALMLVVLQRQPMFHPRYLIAAAPAYYLLLAIAIDGLARVSKTLSYLSLAAAFLLLGLGLNSYYFDSGFAKDDARGVGAFLTTNSSADDLIVLDFPEPVGHYYRGKAPYVYLPGDPAIVSKHLDELGQDKKHVYHVKWSQSRADPAGLVAFLLEKNGTQIESRQFRGFTVNKYKKPAGSRIALEDVGPQTLDVNFDGVLKLESAGYGAAHSEDNQVKSVGALRQGGKLWVTLRWALLRETSREYKAFVHLKSDHDHLVGQSDSVLLKGQLTTNRWKAGDSWRTFHIVDLLPGTPPGSYELVTGLYEARSNVRASVLDANNVPQGASTPLGRLEVVSYPEAVAVRPSARRTGPAVSTKLDRNFGSIRLVGYDLASRIFREGDKLRVTLLWQADDDVKGDYLFGLEAVGDSIGRFGWPAERPNGGANRADKWIRGSLMRDWREYRIPVRFPPGQYQLRGRISKLPEGSEVGVVELGAITVKERPYTNALPGDVTPLEVQFGDVAELAGYAMRPKSVRVGQTLDLTLYWRAIREMDTSYTVFTHMLDAANRVTVQHDGLPALGQRPTTSWRQGEVVADRHLLTIAGADSKGKLTLEVGMYDARRGSRLSASSQTIKLMDDAALIGSLIVD